MSPFTCLHGLMGIEHVHLVEGLAEDSLLKSAALVLVQRRVVDEDPDL